MTIELLGVRVVITFIMVMVTFYAYMIIIHAVRRPMYKVYKTKSFFVVVFFTYESRLSVMPVEHKRKHSDTLPENCCQPYKNITPREQKKEENIASFCSSFRISSIFRA